MNQDPNIDQHSVGKSLLLHLLPGILIGLCYFLLVIPLHQMGFPSIMALMTSFVLILVPVELGYLLYIGKKKNGRFSLQGIVMYRSPIPGWQYFVWVPVLFVIVGIIFTVMKPIDVLSSKYLFFLVTSHGKRSPGGLFKRKPHNHIHNGGDFWCIHRTNC